MKTKLLMFLALTSTSALAAPPMETYSGRDAQGEACTVALMRMETGKIFCKDNQPGLIVEVVARIGGKKIKRKLQEGSCGVINYVPDGFQGTVYSAFTGAPQFMIPGSITQMRVNPDGKPEFFGYVHDTWGHIDERTCALE